MNVNLLSIDFRNSLSLPSTAFSTLSCPSRVSISTAYHIDTSGSHATTPSKPVVVVGLGGLRYLHSLASSSGMGAFLLDVVLGKEAWCISS